MENMTLVRKYLGGTKVVGTLRTEQDLVPMIRQGLPLAVLTSIRNYSRLSEEQICGALRIAKRTIARRKKHSARLNPVESERLLRLARVFATAVDVLGDKDKARAWLLAENRSLGGAVPLERLDTGIGFGEVIDVLKRVEYGVHS